MNAEAELQSELAGFLRRRHDLAKDEDARRFAERHIAGNERLSPVAQLEIYREQFWLRHTASLLEDFPGVAALLGQRSWNRLVEPYLEQAAYYGFSLRDLGEKLPAFIERQPWIAHRVLVLDMARYEWAHVEVFDAPDVPRLDPQKLAAVPEHAWEAARFVLDPALRLLEFEHAVVEFRRQLLLAQAEAAEPPKSPAPAGEPVRLALHRRERIVVAETLAPAAFALLDELGAGTPLRAACELAAAETGSELEALGARLEGWFGEWSQRGYVVDVVAE
jgi:hypothetical protein